MNRVLCFSSGVFNAFSMSRKEFHRSNEDCFSVYTQTRIRRGLLFFLLSIAIIFPDNGICGEGLLKGDGMIIVNKQHNGKEIEAKVGDVIQVELESLGSAGYRWFIENVDANYVTVISERAEATGGEEQIGAPVLSLWRLRLLRKGSTDIKMFHYRDWEGKEKASDSFGIKLNIH